MLTDEVTNIPIHRLPIALAVMSLALAVAACGSSSSKPAKGSSAAGSPIALSRCMRAHGVPNFPDPVMINGTEGFPGGTSQPISQSGSGTPVTVGGVTFSGPAFESAVNTCKMFGSGTAPPPISESQKLGMFAKARCIRRHGVPNFPDPTFGPGGKGVGVHFQGNTSSPTFREAVHACEHVGTPVPIPGAGGG